MPKKPNSRNVSRGQNRPTEITTSLLTGNAEERSLSGQRIIGGITPTGLDKTSKKGPADSSGAQKRKEWEQSEEGQARTRDMTALTGGKLTPGQYHFQRNYDRRVSGPRVYDEQLPGMSDPNAAPRPPRWDELTPSQQQSSINGLEHHGTSIDKIAEDLGAQYDQGVYHANQAGYDRVHSEDFYNDKTSGPRKVIEDSAKDLGIPTTIHAQMNAMTSPNTKFQANRGSTGEVYYPNNEAAVHAVRYAQTRGSSDGITNDLFTTGSGTGKAQGYTTNIKKAAESMSQYQKGRPPSQWVTGANGGGPFDNSPKTGPYANSFSDTEPQFFVSDVHSGGGGAFPHLSSDKPVLTHSDGSIKVDEGGKPKRDKSDREKALADTPFVHSAIDEAARRSMAARNVGSLRGFQAGQWGEEQIQRGLVHEQDVYPARTSKKEDSNQGRLF